MLMFSLERFLGLAWAVGPMAYDVGQEDSAVILVLNISNIQNEDKVMNSKLQQFLYDIVPIHLSQIISSPRIS